MKMSRVFTAGIFLFIFLGCFTPRGESLMLSVNRPVDTRHVGIVVALTKGFYKEEGIDLQLIDFGEQNPLSLITKNEVDLAIDSQGSLTFAVNKGAPLLSVATLFISNPRGLYSLENSGISKPADLQGKVYGGRGSSAEKAVIGTLIQKDGVHHPSFTNQKIQTSGIVNALKTVDFVWGFRAWQGVQLQLARVPFRFLPVGRYIPVLNTYSPIVVVNTQSSIYTEHPDRIQRFLRATEKGARWAKQNKKEAIKALRRYNRTLTVELLDRSLDVLFPRMLTKRGQWGVQDLQRYQGFIQFFREEGFLSPKLKAENLFSNDFLPQEEIEEDLPLVDIED